MFWKTERAYALQSPDFYKKLSASFKLENAGFAVTKMTH